MSRIFLHVQGCHGHTSIALDHLTDDQQRLVEAIADALTQATNGYGCRPSAAVLDTDPDPDDHEPEFPGDTFYRPLVIIRGNRSAETEALRAAQDG